MTANPTKRSFVRLPREQRMRDIENAARKVFSKHGFDSASINEVAAEAGVSEGSIYKFYNSKRELLHTILKAWYSDMIADFKAKLAGVNGTRVRLHVVIWQHLRSIKENPDLCRLFYNEVRSATDYYATDLYELNREYTRVLLVILKDGITAGDIRADVSLALVRDMIFGGIEHHVTAFLMGRGDFDHEETARQLSEIVYTGIQAHGVAPTQDLASVLERLEAVADRLDRPSAEGG